MSKGNYSQNNGKSLEITSGIVSFLCTTLVHNVCYQCLKFKVDGFCLKVMVKK